MGYQENLFAEVVMQDRTARMGGRLRLNVVTRSDCDGGKQDRADGLQSCPFVNCHHHLVGEAMRIGNDDLAAQVQAKRWSGEIRHTCVLDFAELDEGDDDKVGGLLGIPRELVPQRVAEASFKMRKLMKAEQENDDAYAGVEEE